MSLLTDNLLASLNALIVSGGNTPATDVRAYEAQVIAAIAVLETRARGNTIFYTSGVPGNALGLEGDLGVNKLTGDFFQFTNGAFVFLFNGLGKRGVFAPIAANTFGVHPAFNDQDTLNAYLLGHLGSGSGGGVAAPTITSFTPVSGLNGSVVTVTGTNLAGVTAASFNGTAVASGGITANTATSVTLLVPAGATTGTFSLTTAGGSVTSSTSYTVSTPTPGYDGRPVEEYAFGDSRTYGYPDHSSPWPEQMAPLQNQNAGAGKYVTTNGGQSGQGSDFAVSALDTYLLSKRDTVTYWRQLVIVWFGVNDILHNPSWTAQQTIDNLQTVHQRLNAAGFATLAVTEPVSSAWNADPAKRSAINTAIRQNAVSQWGAYAVADTDTIAAIQNMADTAVSPDGLHYTPAIDVNVLAPFFANLANQWAASVGVPTSATGGGGGTVTPGAPSFSYSGRTVTLTAGNGLPSSTLRYTVRGGAVQTGNTYTVPDTQALAVGDLVAYSVATGNYTQSPSSSNATAIAAINQALLYNTDFTAPFAATTTDGWIATNDYGDGRQQVTIGDGAARFKGVQYDAISQQLHTPGGPAPAGTYTATLVVDSISGGQFSLQNTAFNPGQALNAAINTPGTFSFTFTTTGAGEILKLKAEDGVTAVISSLIVVA